MNYKTIAAIALGLLAAACSNEPATTQQADSEAPAANAAANPDDDSLEPAAPAVNEGEEHDESKPHTH